MTENDKFKNSILALKHALEFESKAYKDDFYYGGIAKAFEVTLEYSWKVFRKEVLDAGLEAPSPRDAIKQAGKINLIDDVEKWLRYLKIRNIAVHDYLGLTKEAYLNEIKDFLSEVQKIKL